MKRPQIEDYHEVGAFLRRSPITNKGHGLLSTGYTRARPTGTWKEAHLLGTAKDMLSKVLEMGVCFNRDPVFGERGGTLLS